MTETEKIQSDNQKIRDFVKSDAWSLIKENLISQIMDLQSILNLDGNSPDIVLDLKARRMAIDILREWLRQVEGTAEQHDTNEVLYPDSHIKQFE